MNPIAPWFAGALGACLGSFANVVIYRLPKDQSLVWPSSRCPRCARPIAWYDNVPILSWAVLRGRCRGCRGAISPRYPVVEALTAVLAVLLWRRWSDLGAAWPALATAAAAALVCVTLIDWDTFLIPDELSLGLLVLGLVAAPLNPLYRAAPAWLSFLYALRGGAVGFALCYGVAVVGETAFGKEAMGGGDIKLLAGVGAWTGGIGAYDCLMIASVLGAAYGLTLMIRGRLKKSDPIPFGPFLSAGAILNLFFVLPLGWQLV